jgi:hypothetical protein
MIIIQQTTQPTPAGVAIVANIKDSAGNNLLSNGANALQVEQPNVFTSAVLAALTALTNANSALIDTSASQALTGTNTPLTSATCKKVTLYNLSTNTARIIITINGGLEIPIEAGYSIICNVSNANLITVKSSAGGEIVNYIISA